MTNDTAGMIAADNDNTIFSRAARRRQAAIKAATDPLDDIEAIDTDDSPTGVGSILPTTASREAACIRRAAEAAAMKAAREAIQARQSIGDPACAANDNEDCPVLAVLRRDRLDNFVRLVQRYRQLVALVEAQPLQGLDNARAHSVGALHRSTQLDGAADVDAAHGAAWPADNVPGGEIRYKEAFKLKGGTYSLPAQRAGVAMEENKVRNAPLAVKFNDKVLIAQIDAKPILAELRAALGPLLDPFEDAVLGGQTLTEIGDQEGIGPKGAAGAGKALVFRAMSALDGAWHDIAVRDRKKEREAEAVALRARARIAAKAAAYLGRAA